MGWKWDEEFIKHFAHQMKEFKYSPWWTGAKCAELYEFLDHYGEPEEKDNTQS